MANGTPEFDTMMQGYFAFNETLKAAGVYVSGEGLQDIDTATSVRVRGGKVETMDGPFAETKERLGCFFVMEVPDLDAALRYAAMIPSAAYCTIEVRPLMDSNS
ncbi:YciI family protein [Pararhizobium sp. PWRC1-1]|uniref:YciI family protein n=1 Tax=Pararhizobium sp. PWRC1-1 TaxID=2804566 RepID=UPI003CF21DAC